MSFEAATEAESECPKCGCPTRCPEGELDALREEVDRVMGQRKAALREAQRLQAEVAHGVNRIWTERPGEVSWSCRCGFTWKHLRLNPGDALVPMCPLDAPA